MFKSVKQLDLILTLNFFPSYLVCMPIRECEFSEEKLMFMSVYFFAVANFVSNWVFVECFFVGRLLYKFYPSGKGIILIR